jgi:hypothetical protein
MNHREIFNSKIKDISSRTEKYFNETKQYLDNLNVKELNDLQYFKEIYNKLNEYSQMINSIRISFTLGSIKSFIDKEYESKLDNIEFEKNSLLLSLRDKVNNAIEIKRKEIKKTNEQIKLKNNKLKEEIESENSKYKQLEIKKQRLLEFSNEILQLCSDYGIKTTDININNEMFTIEEFNVFYDEFYAFISSNYDKRNNPIRWIMNKIQSNEIRLFLLIISLMLIFTPAIDILSIILILYIMYNQSIQESLVKKYTIMAGLSFNINPMEIGYLKEIPEDMIEEEISEEIDIDNEPEFKELLEEINSIMESVDDEEIKTEMSGTLSSFMKDYSNMENELNEIIIETDDNKKEILYLIDEKIKELKDKELELKSSIKLLGKEFSEDYIINTNVKLGLNKDTMIYETLDIGLKNIVFKQKGTQKELDDFIKIMVANYYCNVRPGFLDITVYDPNNMGRSLSGFYNDDLDNLFKIYNGTLDELMKEFKEHTNDMMKVIKESDINEYNYNAKSIGKSCLYYKLLIILSQPKNIEENEALQSFMEYSAKLGVFVWVVSDSNFNNTYVFNKPFEKIINPIEIDSFNFPEEIMYNMYISYKALKSPALLWDDFRDRSISEDKIWTYNADEFIELNPGYEDGDPSKSVSYTLGNVGDIHGLGVGGTGSGKSVFVNNLIANICTKYNPKDISLWLVDFKGSEFNFYLQKPEIGQKYILPHIDACLCTSDPDFSVSLFSAIRKEADDRYKFLMSKGYKNMYEYNKSMRKEDTPELCLKRTLVIVDEFQVIFEKTDSKAQEILKKHITQLSKVARAAGIHLLFFSQSMTGTISNDILSQFTLRFALRCPMDVSMSIMGTKYAGDIREKNGYLYVSSSDDKKKELQKKFRTPFIPDKTLRNQIDTLYKRYMLESYRREKEAITYDETTIHELSEVDELYSTILKDIDMNNRMILGERMVYSNKGRRANILFDRENNTHVFSVFENNEDLIWFFNTIMFNIGKTENANVIFNSVDKDLTYLFDLDYYINKYNCKEFNNPEMTPDILLKTFKDINERRKTIDTNILKPLYIVLIGWNKLMKFGVANDFKLTDPYVTLMQVCGSMHIHFIFISKSNADIPKQISNISNYRIAGKCDSKSSTILFDSDVAYKNYEQDNGYMFLYNSGSIERLKIYRSKINKELKEKEIII